MADQSGKVGEVYIDVRLRLNEADKARVSSEVGAISPGSPGAAGGGAGGRGSSSSAVLLAQARLEAAQARLNIGPSAQAETLIARSADERIHLVGRLGLETSGTLKQASIAEAAVRRAESEGRRADAREFSWATKSFRSARREFEAADRAEASWAVSSFREARSAMDRVDRSFDSASLAQQKAMDANERRYQANKDAADLAAQRQQERAAAAAVGRAARDANNPRNRWYNQEVMSTGMLMQVMFGGWEVATGFRNLSKNNTARSLATDAIGLANADYQLIQSVQSGPMGSLVGLALDPTGSSANRLQTAVASANATEASSLGMVEMRNRSAQLARGAAASGMVGSSAAIAAITSKKADEKLKIDAMRDEQNKLNEAQITAEKARLASTFEDRVSREFDRAAMERYRATGKSTPGTRENYDVARGTISTQDQQTISNLRTGLDSRTNAQYSSQIASLNNLTQNEIKKIGTALVVTLRDAAIQVKTDSANRLTGAKGYAARLGALNSQYAAAASDILSNTDASSPLGMVERYGALGNLAGRYANSRAELKDDMIADDQRRAREMRNNEQTRQSYMVAGATMNMGGFVAAAINNEMERRNAVENAAPGTHSAVDQYYRSRQQSLVLENMRATRSLRNDNRILDILNGGGVNAGVEAQGQQIVDSALGQLEGATATQKQLIATRAGKQLDLLQRQQISQNGQLTPSLFYTGGSATPPDFAGLRKQLNAGIVADAVGGAILGENQGLPKEVVPILREILTTLGKLVN